MRVIQFIFTLIAVTLLAGCSYMTDVSNKNPSVQTEAVGLKSAEPANVCQNWCHNGWCSTHCEKGANAN